MWEDPSSLRYVPDWFVTQLQIDIWHEDDCYSNKLYITEWYEGYQKGKAHKAKIKKELTLLLSVHQDGGNGVFLKMKK